MFRRALGQSETGIPSVFYRLANEIRKLITEINVEPGHNCEVRVLQSPIEQQIGELNVDRFPCDFTDYELIYQHFGRSQPREDRISMQGTIFQ